MMKNKIDLLLIIILSMVIFACTSNEEKNQCTPVPDEFSKEDLFGTWFAGYVSNPVRNETIIIRDDGTYKQIIQIENPAFTYESEWLPWQLEKKINNIHYLRLEGMKLCAYWPYIDCEDSGGGDEYWYDFCQKNWIQTPNHGIILVLGVPKQFTQSPKEIELFLLKKFSEGVWKYEYQEQ